jgi:hypothetical protein
VIREGGAILITSRVVRLILSPTQESHSAIAIIPTSLIVPTLPPSITTRQTRASRLIDTSLSDPLSRLAEVFNARGRNQPRLRSESVHLDVAPKVDLGAAILDTHF